MLRAVIDWRGPSEGLSVMHSTATLAESGAAQAFADAIQGWLQNIDAFLSSNQSMRVRPEILEVNPSTGAIQASTTVTTSSVAGAGLPAQVAQATCVLSRWRTGSYVGGREVRGRTYIPGLGVDQLTDEGELDPSALALLTQYGNTLASGSTLAVWSPSTGGVVEVASCTVWSELAVQRRRRD